MNDKLKRRVTGATVIVLVALALAALLPEPRLAPSVDDGVQVVTIPLREDVIASRPAGDAERPATGAVDADSSPPEIAPGDAPGATPDASPVPTSPPLKLSSSLSTSAPPVPAAASAAPAQPTPSATATPVPTARPTVSATPRPTPAAIPAPTGVAAYAPSWWVQVGSYADIGNAREVETRLAALGQPVIVAPIDAASGTLYRVRAGPYANAERAESAHAQIVRAGLAEARIIKP